MIERTESKYSGLRPRILQDTCEMQPASHGFVRDEYLVKTMIILGNLATTLGPKEKSCLKKELRKLDPNPSFPHRGSLSDRLKSVHAKLEKYYDAQYGFMRTTQPEVTGKALAAIDIILNCLPIIVSGSDINVPDTMLKYFREEGTWAARVHMHNERDLSHISSDSSWKKAMDDGFKSLEQLYNQRSNTQVANL